VVDDAVAEVGGEDLSELRPGRKEADRTRGGVGASDKRLAQREQILFAPRLEAKRV
jgi:hypothetical protein